MSSLPPRSWSTGTPSVSDRPNIRAEAAAAAHASAAHDAARTYPWAALPSMPLSLGSSMALNSSSPTVSAAAPSSASFETGSIQRVSAPSSGRPGMILGVAAPPATMPMIRATAAAQAAATASRTMRLTASS